MRYEWRQALLMKELSEVVEAEYCSLSKQDYNNSNIISKIEPFPLSSPSKSTFSRKTEIEQHHWMEKRTGESLVSER